MKIVYSESVTDYSTYTFSYAVHCLPESPGELPEIYGRGFLPASSDPNAPALRFYLARSLRVDLERFADTSENRRVDRKAAALGLELERRPRRPEDADDPVLIAFCTAYARERFVGGAMDEARLRYILGGPVLTDLLLFRQGESVLGSVFAVITADLLHYWFSFYDTAYMRSHSLGKWMMWRTLHWARAQGLRYVYLGTCYGSKGLYKVRDHLGIEFFDGAGWNPDRAALIALCHQDERSNPADPGQDSAGP